MENSKRRSIPMQEKLILSKSQGASTSKEVRRMQRVPYASVVGSIMYTTVVKNIVKYLRNTKGMVLFYGGDMEQELSVTCYTDVGYLTHADDSKSKTRYVFVLNGGVVDLKSAKQSPKTTSSTEAEHMAASKAAKEAVWIKKFIFGLDVKGSEGGRGVKEKKHGSAQEATIDIDNVVSSADVTMGADVNSNANVEPTASASILASMSFATLLKGDTSQKSVNFRTLFTLKRKGVDVAVPLKSIRAVNEWFANMAYGLLLGNRVAYPFSSKDSLDTMLENGPWFIRNNPLILKRWNPDVNLLKEDVGNVSVWVKLYGVPMTTFNEDGLSVIATKLGTPLMLDSFTSDMCMKSWGSMSGNLPGVRHVLDECPKNIVSDVEKNLKNPRQAARGVQQVAVASKEVSNSNPFDMHNLVEKDDNFERQIIDGKFTLVDDDRKPLSKVVSKENVDSDSEVKDVLVGTTEDDDYDPYDADLSESQDMSENIQAICDDLVSHSMCLQSWGRINYPRALIDIRVDRELNEDMVVAIPIVKDDGEVLHMVRVKYEWEPPRCGKKVVQDMAGLASGSPSNTPLVIRINEQESHMIKGTLVLLDDDGKPLKHSKSTLPSSSNVVSNKVDDLVNEDNDSEVEEENHGEDPYNDDDFDDPGLTDAQIKFANTFYINLRG
ncbi:retrotransposon protein, putative, ty1-copia subclass [Tanacetum coccineum]